jgi:lantibiotic biosynthesis protein
MNTQTLHTALAAKISETELALAGQITYEHPALFAGLGGITLFYTNLYQHTKNETHIERAYLLLNQLMENMEKLEMNFSFESGIAGTGWLTQYLVNQELLDKEFADDLAGFDTMILQSLEEDARLKRYDFFTGITGKGAYLLERLACDPGVAHAVQRRTEVLLDLKESDPERGIFWQGYYGVKREYAEQTSCSLGVAHGMCGILNYLSFAEQSGVLPYSLRPELEGMVRYLNKMRYTAEGITCYPYHTQLHQPAPNDVPSRLAWCHGDPGILLSILNCAAVLKDNEMFEAAASKVPAMATRRDAQQGGIMDAGLCHGAAGLAHLYHRIYQHTKQEAVQEAAQYWYEIALEMGQAAEGYAGYRVWTGDPEREWLNSQGFLTGVAGIGLSLLSATGVPHSWDRCLILSSPFE